MAASVGRKRLSGVGSDYLLETKDPRLSGESQRSRILSVCRCVLGWGEGGLGGLMCSDARPLTPPEAETANASPPRDWTLRFPFAELRFVCSFIFDLSLSKCYSRKEEEGVFLLSRQVLRVHLEGAVRLLQRH